MRTRSVLVGLLTAVAVGVGAPSAWAAGGNGASYCSNSSAPDGVVDVEAVQGGDIASVDNPGEFVTALAPLPGLRGSGWGFQNFCRPGR